MKLRNASDYDDMYIATEKEAIEQIERAACFYKIIEEYVKIKLNEQ